MGGAEQILKMLALYYSKRGYTVDVYFACRHQSNFWQDKTENIHLYYTARNNLLWGIMELKSLLKKNKKSYNLIFTSHVYLNSFLGRWRKQGIVVGDYFVGRDSRSYYKANSGLKLKIYSNLIRRGYGYLDLLICQTEDMKTLFCEKNTELSKKIKIVNLSNPIDHEQINHHKEAKNQLDVNGNYIVAAGRLIKIKGFDILIKAFCDSDIKDGYKLVIIGEGPERKQLESLIRECDLAGKVFLPGFQENVFPIFRDASLCVVSSIMEGFPNVLLQMMAQNTNVVATLCAGGINRLSGVFTCPPNDVNSLRESMESCLNAETHGNRSLFDIELKKRDINGFVNEINRTLEC